MNSKDIAICSIFTALYSVAILLTNFFFGVELLIVLSTPFILYVIKEKTNFVSLLAFSFATFFIGLGISYITTICYLLPSLIIGLAYVLIFKWRKDIIVVMLSLATLHAILLYLVIIFCDFLLGTKILEDLPRVLHISSATFSNWELVIFLLAGLSESTLTGFIFYYEYNRFHKNRLVVEPSFTLLVINFVLFIALFFLPWRYLYPVFILFLLAYLINVGFGLRQAKKGIILYQILAFIGMLLLLTILKEETKVLAYLTLGLPSIVYLFNYLLNRQKNGKIEKREELKL